MKPLTEVETSSFR